MVDLLAAFVAQGLDPPELRAGQQNVALAQAALRHQQSSYRAAAGLDGRFNYHAAGAALAPGPELQQIRLQLYFLQQVVDAFAGKGRNLGDLRIAAIFLRREAQHVELVAHLSGIGVLQVDLVDRNHDGHLGGLRVFDRLLGLRLDAVVGGDDQDNDIGQAGAAGPHGGEGRMTGRVQEGNRAVARPHPVSADVLRDAARFRGGNAAAAHVVQQRSLAVIDVAHDGHDRVARLLLAGDRNGPLEQDRLFVGFGLGYDLVAHGLDDDHRGRLVQGVVDARQHAFLHEFGDDLLRADRHLARQFRHSNGLGHFHRMHDRRGGPHKGIDVLHLGRRAPARLAAPGAARAHMGGHVQLFPRRRFPRSRSLGGPRRLACGIFAGPGRLGRLRPALLLRLSLRLFPLQASLFLRLFELGLLLGLLLGVFLGLRLARLLAFGLLLLLARLLLGELPLLLFGFLRGLAFLFQPARFLLLAARKGFALQRRAVYEFPLAPKIDLDGPAAPLVNLHHLYGFTAGNADFPRHRGVPGHGLAVPVTAAQKCQQLFAGHVRDGLAGVLEAVPGTLKLVHQVLHRHLEVLGKFGDGQVSHFPPAPPPAPPAPPPRQTRAPAPP